MYNPPQATFCVVEDPLVQGSMTKAGGACFATMTSTPKQQTFRVLKGTSFCIDPTGANGSFTSLNVAFPTLPWIHMVATSIGSWSNPTIYPSNESVWVDEGLFVRHDGCQGDFLSIDYGATTEGGFTKMLPIPVLASVFVDLADNYTAPLLGPYPFPILGNVLQTDHLIYVNAP